MDNIDTKSYNEEYSDYDEQYNPEIRARVPKLTEKEKKEVLKRILKNNPVVNTCASRKELHEYYKKLCNV